MKNGTRETATASAIGEENRAAKRSVSGPPDLFAAAEKIMRKRRIWNFSEYVRSLIREDLEKVVK